ncbi:hypothetical protein L7F22_061830 [Adiantum nelumboides]|nr:hypothetical protein [Adiantum nelumboides]
MEDPPEAEDQEEVLQRESVLRHEDNGTIPWCGNIKHRTLQLQSSRVWWQRCSSLSNQSYSMSEQQLTYLRNSVTKARIYLVAVSHISARSVEHVRHVIRHYKPEVIGLELCKERAAALLSRKKQEERGWRDFISMEGSIRERLIKFFIQYIYTFIANETEESLPGEELRVAMLEGHAIGARLLCIDRDFNDVDQLQAKSTDGHSWWLELPLKYSEATGPPIEPQAEAAH